MDANDRNDMYDRLPPELKREFLHKQARLSGEQEEYEAALRRKVVIGTAVGACIGTGVAVIMSYPSVISAIVIAVCNAIVIHQIMSRQMGHLASMLLPGGVSVVLSSIFLAVGLIPIKDPFDFVWLISGWGSFVGLGGTLAYWARETKSPIPYSPPPEEDDHQTPQLRPPGR